MHKRFGFVIVLPAFVLSAGTLSAQAWELKDSGVGLVVQDADYDKQLKIARRGDSWDLEDLDEKGALANKYDGNQGFAAWLAGPHTDTYHPGTRAVHSRYDTHADISSSHVDI